jgi:hypothetical protein
MCLEGGVSDEGWMGGGAGGIVLLEEDGEDAEADDTVVDIPP